jgi:tetratricopeptide (TPR) repeat protein
MADLVGSLPTEGRAQGDVLYYNIGADVMVRGTPGEVLEFVRNPKIYAEMAIMAASKMCRRGNIDQAEKNAALAVELAPENARAWGLYGGIKNVQKSPVLGEALCRSGLAHDPDDFMCNANLAQALVAQEKFEEAEPFVRKALELKPDRIQLVSLLLQSLWGQSKYQEAVDVLADAPESLQENPLINQLFSLCYLKLGQYDKAEVMLAGITDREPGNTTAHINLTHALMQQKKLHIAFHYAAEVVQLAPASPEGHFNLAVCFEDMGCVTEARDHYQLALAWSAADSHLLPQMQDALSNLGKNSGTAPEAPAAG